MITKKKLVQTCAMDQYKVHETLIKLIPTNTKTLYMLIPICIKNGKKCHILQRNNCMVYYTKSQKCTVWETNLTENYYVFI